MSRVAIQMRNVTDAQSRSQTATLPNKLACKFTKIRKLPLCLAKRTDPEFDTLVAQSQPLVV